MIASGETPRPAPPDVSLFFSTSVEPRTVRAYCTPAGQGDGEHQYRVSHLTVRLAREGGARHAVDQQRDEDRRE